jgi:hypothetical protein
MNPRLVQDDMRELGQPIFDVLNSPGADDVRTLVFIGLPERRLIDPVRLFQHPLAETERLEHLHCAARDAVSLPETQRTGFLVDDPGLDVRKGGELRSQCQPCWPAAHNQEIDFFG